MNSDCAHENVRTFRSVPPHSKCLDCGLPVELVWVVKQS